MRAARLMRVPAMASQIEILLDVILQILSVLEVIGRLFGIQFGGE